MPTAVITVPNAAIPLYRRKCAADISAAQKHAAGTLFVAPDGDVLMLHRARDGGNFQGHWALPGGGVDDGEAPDLGARREAIEEMGEEVPDGKRKALDQRVTPTGTAFHTFVQPVPAKFVPKLNDEHTGYAWASLNQLPRPLHPAVEATLRERVGLADDMAPEDWEGLRDGFLQWIAEEEAEGEHADDEFKIKNQGIKLNGAHDSALRLALDRDPNRVVDDEGRMHVGVTHICKACVSPYLGREIPDWEELGLVSDKTYELLRDPEELKRAVPTFNHLPLLRKHVATSADDHPKDDVVGSVGSHATWNDPYVDNSLVIWVGEDVQGVDAKRKHELSPGYKYRADMTPGNFNGTRYDGVMRDIVGNHVAIVEDGRQGPDVVVGDSAEELMSTAALAKKMNAISIRQVTVGALSTYLRPRLAMDAKISIGKALEGVTGKTFSASKPKIAASIRDQAKGKMAKDASLEDVEKVLGMLEKHEVEAGDEIVAPTEHAAMEAAALACPPVAVPPPVTDEHAGIKDFLKTKGLGEDDIKAACDLLPKALGKDEEEETEEEKKKREEKEAAEKAADEFPDKDKDKEKPVAEDKITKGAMDAAITAAVDKARKDERDIRAALDEVRPYVGDLAMAFDSGSAVRRHALKMLNVPEHANLHESALSTILRMQAKAGAKPNPTPLGMDEAVIADANKRFPNLARIRPA